MIEPSKHIIRALADYLQAELPDLADVIENFPQPSEELQLPCVSVFIGQPAFTNKMPELLGTADLSPPVANKKRSTYAVGSYDYRLQLDIWTGSKEERHQIFSDLFAAINKNVNPMGLSLTLADYNNEICRFDMVGHQFMDAEVNAQRQEWRVQVTVLAHGRVLMTKDEFIMSNIENNFSTPNNIPE